MARLALSSPARLSQRLRYAAILLSLLALIAWLEMAAIAG